MFRPRTVDEVYDVKEDNFSFHFIPKLDDCPYPAYTIYKALFPVLEDAKKEVAKALAKAPHLL